MTVIPTSEIIEIVNVTARKLEIDLWEASGYVTTLGPKEQAVIRKALADTIELVLTKACQ